MAFGRLERTAAQKPMAEINVTPLVDVMMVLLVIFIITAPLMVSSLKLDLPKSEGAHASAPPKAISVSIDAKGVVYLDDQSLSLDALQHALQVRAAQALAQGQGELPEVQLRADESVPYGRVVDVMGLAQQAGLHRLGFVTEAKSTGLRAAERAAKP